MMMVGVDDSSREVLGLRVDSHFVLVCIHQMTSHNDFVISQLPNLFIGTPRITNFILFLIVWVHSFSKMLTSVKFAEDVLIFVILCKKC